MFGVGDFCGGMAAKRATTVQVVAGSHLIGAAGALAAAIALADAFTWRDLALGAAGGAFGMVGVGLLYRRLAAGPMSIVAPLTAITSAVVPALWGVAGGERLRPIGWLGLAVGLAAVLLVSLSPDEVGGGSATPSVTTTVVVESLLAGVGFGAMFIFLDATEAGSAPWPVVGARVLSSSILIALLLVAAGLGRGPVLPVDRGVWWLIALVGVPDTASNITFLYASNQGRLAVVSVLAALYPISTVILARLVLSERMSRPQGLGFASALVSTALLASA
jgi:drug/metabolite transporter (DMT)-like permease